MVLRVSQVNYVFLVAPLVMICMASVVNRFSWNSKHADSSSVTFDRLDLMRHKLKKNDLNAVRKMLNQRENYSMSMTKDDSEDCGRMLIVELSMRLLLMRAQDLRRQHDVNSAKLFEKNACEILRSTYQVQDSRPCVQINMKQLTKYAKKYQANQFLKTILKNMPVEKYNRCTVH